MKKHRRRIFTKYHVISFITVLAIYMGLVVINYFALKKNGEDYSFIDVLWIDILTITGNDYEFISTPGTRLIGIFFLLISLLFLSMVTGYISSLLVDRKLNSKRGLKRMQNLKNHIIICGWKNDIKSLVLDILRKNKKLPIDQIVIVTNEDVDKIQALRDDPELKGLNILKGDYTLEQTLNNISAKYASKVLIIGENQESLDAELVDSRVFVTALMFRNINSRCHICAEIKTERYKNYLEAQNCAEVIYTDEYTRYILSTSTNYSGISKVLSSFLDNGDGKSVQIEKIKENFIGKPFIDLFNWYKKEKNILVIGILENMGVEKELKHEILAEAQKSTNYGEIIQKMRTVKTLETNHPVLNPSDDYILERNMGVIIIGGGNIMNKIDELKKFPLLKNLTDEDLKSLEEYVNEVTFNEGEDIIKEGEIGDTLYLLIDGSVDVIKTTIFDDEFICASLNSSMHCLFGEMAVIDNDKRSATIKAKTKCDTLELNKENFSKYCDEHPKAGIELLKMMNINIVRNLRIENDNLKLVYQALIEEIEND